MKEKIDYERYVTNMPNGYPQIGLGSFLGLLPSGSGFFYHETVKQGGELMEKLGPFVHGMGIAGIVGGAGLTFAILYPGIKITLKRRRIKKFVRKNEELIKESGLKDEVYLDEPWSEDEYKKLQKLKEIARPEVKDEDLLTRIRKSEVVA